MRFGLCVCIQPLHRAAVIVSSFSHRFYGDKCEDIGFYRDVYRTGAQRLARG